jgi:hypothetical protein
MGAMIEALFAPDVSHPSWINTKTAEQKLNGLCGDP